MESNKVTFEINDINAVLIFWNGVYQYCRIFNTRKIAESVAQELSASSLLDLNISRKIMGLY